MSDNLRQTNFLGGFFEKSTHKKSKYFLTYTIIFAAVWTLCYISFFDTGKSFIVIPDGYGQHYPALVYIGRWIRETFLGFLHGNFSVPMFDTRIGAGLDVITTLHYYGLGDPLLLSSALVPSQYTEILYDFLCMFRMYLSGLAFSYYCINRNHKMSFTLCGAITYAFCAYSLFLSIRQPFFINAMIYLPLILAGIDKIFENKRPYLFIAMISISALSNFYFFYVLCIFSVLYAVFRYIQVFKRIKLKTLVKTVFKFILFAAIGVMISCVIFLPVVFMFVSSVRTSVDDYVPLFYDAKYLKGLFGGMISYGNIQYWSQYQTMIGIASPAVTGVFSLFVTKGNKTLKAGFLCLTVFLFVPFISSLFNGFSYVCGRWVFAYQMILSYIFVKMLPEMKELGRTQKAIICALSVCYFIFIAANENTRTVLNIVGGIILLAFVIFILLTSYQSVKNFYMPVTALLCVSAIVSSSFLKNSPAFNNYVSEFRDRNTSYISHRENQPENSVKAANDQSFFRTERSSTNGGYLRNSQLINDLNTYMSYYSIQDSYISEFQRNQCINIDTDYISRCFDYRSVCMSLFSVKYYVLSSPEAFLPYGFEYAFTDEHLKNKVYINKNCLPIGYTYDKAVSYDYYMSLSPEERQQVISQAAVSDNLYDIGADSKEIDFNSVKEKYEVIDTDGIRAEDNSFEIYKPGATVTFNIPSAKENSELYLVLEGAQFEGMHTYDMLSDSQKTQIPQSELDKLKADAENLSVPTACVSTISRGDFKNTFNIKNRKNNFYAEKENFIVCLGYSKHSETNQKISITFNAAGRITAKSIRFVSQPMDNTDSLISALKEDVLENVNINTNKISGSISLDRNKMLCLSIPYNDGWSVTVDGDEYKTERINDTFLGVYLPAGNHDIVFSYRTPYIFTGLALSTAGIIAFAAIIIITERRRKKSSTSLK